MEFRDWLLALALLGQFGNSAWLYIERRNDKTNERVTNLAGKVEQLDKDVVVATGLADGMTTLVGKVEQLDRDVSSLNATTAGSPNHADLAKVYESINSLAATVHTLVGENRGQSDTLRLILNQITQKGLA